MGLTLFTDKTSWENARKDVRHTASTATASVAHVALAKPLKALLTRCNETDQERRDADDQLVDANALVAWIDVRRLDPLVTELASWLLHDAKQDRSDPKFKRYFAEPPNEIVRMGLESEIKRTKAFFHVAEEIPPSKETKAILAKIAAVHKQGEAALAAREEATLHVARLSLRIQTWKEDANGVRRSVENNLDAHANAHGLPRDYSDAFFPASRATKSPAAKTPATPAPPPSPPQSPSPELSIDQISSFPLNLWGSGASRANADRDPRGAHLGSRGVRTHRPGARKSDDAAGSDGDAGGGSARGQGFGGLHGGR
jgi:hypothetical protein